MPESPEICVITGCCVVARTLHNRMGVCARGLPIVACGAGRLMARAHPSRPGASRVSKGV